MKIALKWTSLAFILPLLVYLFLSYWPIIRSYQTAPPDRYYWGSVDYAIDTVGNMTTVREGYLGHWQRFSKITSTIEGKPSLLKFEYILVGQIARMTGVDPLVMFYVTRAIISLVLIGVIYFLITRMFAAAVDRWMAFMFVLFATGVTEVWKVWPTRVIQKAKIISLDTNDYV